MWGKEPKCYAGEPSKGDVWDDLLARGASERIFSIVPSRWWTKMAIVVGLLILVLLAIAAGQSAFGQHRAGDSVPFAAASIAAAVILFRAGNYFRPVRWRLREEFKRGRKKGRIIVRSVGRNEPLDSEAMADLKRDLRALSRSLGRPASADAADVAA